MYCLSVSAAFLGCESDRIELEHRRPNLASLSLGLGPSDGSILPLLLSQVTESKQINQQVSAASEPTWSTAFSADARNGAHDPVELGGRRRDSRPWKPRRHNMSTLNAGLRAKLLMSEHHLSLILTGSKRTHTWRTICRPTLLDWSAVGSGRSHRESAGRRVTHLRFIPR